MVPRDSLVVPRDSLVVPRDCCGVPRDSLVTTAEFRNVPLRSNTAGRAGASPAQFLPLAPEKTLCCVWLLQSDRAGAGLELELELPSVSYHLPLEGE
eukprot:COSAG06_NODE_837_length_12033_cov_4.155574_4_plen_97_part_00